NGQSGGATFGLTYKLRNYGKSPAQIISAELRTSHAASYPQPDIDKLIREIEERPPVQQGKPFDAVFPDVNMGIEKRRSQTSFDYRDPQWLIAFVLYKDGSGSPCLRHTLRLYIVNWTKPFDERRNPQVQTCSLEPYSTKAD